MKHRGFGRYFRTHNKPFKVKNLRGLVVLSGQIPNNTKQVLKGPQSGRGGLFNYIRLHRSQLDKVAERTEQLNEYENLNFVERFMRRVREIFWHQPSLLQDDITDLIELGSYCFDIIEGELDG